MSTRPSGNSSSAFSSSVVTWNRDDRRNQHLCRGPARRSIVAHGFGGRDCDEQSLSVQMPVRAGLGYRSSVVFAEFEASAETGLAEGAAIVSRCRPPIHEMDLNRSWRNADDADAFAVILPNLIAPNCLHFWKPPNATRVVVCRVVWLLIGRMLTACGSRCGGRTQFNVTAEPA